MNTRTVALAASLLSLGGCAGKAWREARRANTSQAYAAFVANNPEHGKVRVARVRAEALDWEATIEADTADAYALFIATHPTSPHVLDARERGEVVAWEEAVADGSVAALEGYLARYGSGDHEREARERIEDAWYEQSREDDTVDSWSRYLVRYPVGRYVDEARRRRDALGWEATTSAGTPSAYRAYLRQHPRGTHRQEARDWLAGLRVHTLQPVLVYRRTWRDPALRERDRARYLEDFEMGLLYDLARDFTIRDTLVDDDPAHGLPHVQERHGTEPGVGLLELVVDEVEGRRFEPSGHATDITGTLSLFAPPTREAIWHRELTATTPTSLYGSTVESLYTEAVDEFGALVRGVAFPIEKVAPEKPAP